MAKLTTVQAVADDLQLLVTKQEHLMKDMGAGRIGRRKAYEALKQIRADINRLVGRLGSV